MSEWVRWRVAAGIALITFLGIFFGGAGIVGYEYALGFMVGWAVCGLYITAYLAWHERPSRESLHASDGAKL